MPRAGSLCLCPRFLWFVPPSAICAPGRRLLWLGDDRDPVAVPMTNLMLAHGFWRVRFRSTSSDASPSLADRPKDARVPRPRRRRWAHGLHVACAALTSSVSADSLALVAAGIACVPALVAHRCAAGGSPASLTIPRCPRRLYAGRQVTGSWFLGTSAALFVLTGSAAIWAIPLAAIAYLAAGLPLRGSSTTKRGASRPISRSRFASSSLAGASGCSCAPCPHWRSEPLSAPGSSRSQWAPG